MRIDAAFIVSTRLPDRELRVRPSYVHDFQVGKVGSFCPTHYSCKGSHESRDLPIDSCTRAASGLAPQCGHDPFTLEISTTEDQQGMNEYE